MGYGKLFLLSRSLGISEKRIINVDSLSIKNYKEYLNQLTMNDKPRVLVIDDDEDIVKLAKIMIGYMGYEVTATTDNLSVFDILNEEKYSLLLLDIQMPYMNGYDICRKVREGPYKDIKIVLFTASADVDVYKKGKAAGADDVLSKPFSIDKIKDTVKRVLEEQYIPLSSGEQFTHVYAP